MRFIHIADVHLGAAPDRGRPWSKRRADEIWGSFRAVIDAAEREQADLLLIAGDLFHRQPLPRELKEVNYLFGTLSRTQVVLIAGNHDYLRQGSAYCDFEWTENVVFLDGGECERVCFRDLHTFVYGLSYHQREIREPLYDRLRPGGEQGCHILLAHGGDESHIPIDRRQIAKNGFDYVALGHIHRPQSIAENMAYAGALEPIDVNDTGPHGYIFGEYRDGEVRTRFVPSAVREYVHLEIACGRGMTDLAVRDAVRRAVAAHGQENLYRILLTGYRDADVDLCTELYRDLGNIVQIEDQTEADYDFERLMAVHSQDVIGRYIGALIQERGGISRRALTLGVRELLGGK